MIDIIIGCPTRNRTWILPTWKKYVEEAVPDDWYCSYVFVVGEDDEETIEMLSSWDSTKIIKVTEPEIPEERSWGNKERFRHMAFLRNTMLDYVRKQSPDLFLSLDSDILINSKTICNLYETVVQCNADAVGGLTYFDQMDQRTTNVASWNDKRSKTVSYTHLLEYNQMKEKHEFMIENIGKTQHDFAVYLAKQTMMEGISLFASFAMLLNFDRLGKLPGMCDIVRWSMVDESIHIEGNCALFREFLEEHPSIVNDVFKKEVYRTARKLVKLEDSFIDRAFKLGGVDNLDKEDVKKYVRYVADYRLQQLGFKKNWHVKENPLEWIDSMMGKTFGNFFEREAVSYTHLDVYKRQR